MLLTGTITQLVLAIISKDTRMPLGRWMFDINLVQTEGEEGPDVK
jgi:mitotic spindle assembly checkpoint protein MAD2